MCHGTYCTALLTQTSNTTDLLQGHMATRREVRTARTGKSTLLSLSPSSTPYYRLSWCSEDEIVNLFPRQTPPTNTQRCLPSGLPSYTHSTRRTLLYKHSTSFTPSLESRQSSWSLYSPVHHPPSRLLAPHTHGALKSSMAYIRFYSSVCKLKTSGGSSFHVSRRVS